ncbi:uncharacterized protein LOC126354210 isoform X2 [Schistocerca gregaria]|uniref:uncharacterized protein LOC126354210 isoform X2 n=1 Tax=Schistocerca gregaria TaxID=7010 RepID=UPI00211E2200|nr:uncharacterized protein LOC126354210 isoform X2 [Schistocerca gregaria]
MAAEQVKLKCAFRSGSLLVVVLLHAVAYSTATGAFVRYLPDPAANVVPNVPPETYFHYVAESDSSTQSTVIRIKQEPYVVVKVSNLEFCTVIWSNKHLLRRVPARRAIKDFCRSIRQSGKEMVTATEVTSVLDVTATGESGKALRAEAGLADRQDPSAEALNLKKLSKWCKYRKQIDNKLVRIYLPDICSNLDKTVPGKSTAIVTEVPSGHELMTTAVTSTFEGTFDTSRASQVDTSMTSSLQHVEPPLLTLSSIKIREVCKHVDEVRNKLDGPFLLAICRWLNKADTDMSAESNGTVTFAQVTKDADPITEAVTLKTAYTYSAQSAVTSLKPEMGAAYNISDTELGVLVCQNFHLINISVSFIARRTLGLYCKVMNLTDTGTSTAAATEVMSARKLTATAAAGTSEGPSGTSRVPDTEQAATSLTQQKEPSSHISSSTKLKEVCRHLNQVKNKMFGPFLPALCKHVDEPDTDMSAESNRTVTTAQVTKDADPITEAVTLKTAYTYSAQSAVTSLKPETGAAYNISNTELGVLVCQNFRLIDNSLSFIARRALLLYCKNMKLTDTGTSTAAATDVMSTRKLTTTAAAGTSEGPSDTSRVPDAEQAATSLTQQEEPSSHISSLTKLREVCRHLNQVKNKMFGPFLPALCKHVDEPDTGTSTAAATEVMSTRKLTTTAAAGTSEGPSDTSRVPDAEQAATSLTQQEEPSSHISSLTKLREVCRHLNQVKNKMFGPFLPALCKHVDEPDKSAELNGTVTAAKVNKDVDTMTEAVTLKTAYTYSAQSAVTSLKPEMGAAYNVSDTELGQLVCQNFILIDNSLSFIARRALLLYCKNMKLTGTATITAGATEVISARKLTTTAAAGTSEGPFDTSRVPDTEPAATSLTQQEEPSSHISSLTKLREVCRHLNQVKNKMFGPFLPALCKHVDEPDSTAQPYKQMTSSPSGEPIKGSNDETVDEAVDESTNEAARPTTLMTNTRRHESVDESINKSYEECGFESYDDIDTY